MDGALADPTNSAATAVSAVRSRLVAKVGAARLVRSGTLASESRVCRLPYCAGRRLTRMLWSATTSPSLTFLRMWIQGGASRLTVRSRTELRLSRLAHGGNHSRQLVSRRHDRPLVPTTPSGP